jgi:hypothetical protein
VISALKFDEDENIYDISLTLDVSHLERSDKKLDEK